MNKKGFMRIVEATVAVIIILAAMLLLSNQKTQNSSINLGENLPQLLDEIANNATMRQIILDSSNEDNTKKILEEFLADKINPSANYSVELCEFTEPCYIFPYPDTEQEIFASERIISTTIRETSFSPKKIKLFVWLKDGR